MSVSKYAGWPVVVTAQSTRWAWLSPGAAGVAFGLWPAWQAAKVNLIEALRSD